VIAPSYKIAMVTPGPFPAPRGSQVLVRELAESLVKLGHRVHVVAYGGGQSGSPPEGVDVHRTPFILGGGESFGPRPWRLALNLALLRKLLQVVREHAIDVIHAHNYEAPLLGYIVRRLTGVPVVYHGHNLMSDELGRYFESAAVRRLATVLGGVLDRSVPRRADYVVALSEAMATHLRAHGVPAERIEVIPPGVFCTAEAHPGLAADPFPGVKVVAYAGNLDPYQDVPTLVRAMREVSRREPQALLVIVTHASDRRLEGTIRRLGLAGCVRVDVVGGFEAVRRLLRRADVVVCPRASWSGFPIKLLNYMAAGRPVIAAAGAARALGNGPLVVVPDADPQALAQAIVSTLGDPVCRSRLGREGRKLVRRAHDWRLLAPRVVSVYARVLSRRAHPWSGRETCEKVLQKAAV
jgi:glycosyltransferase involved in cell wall biosynthesis